MAVRSSINLFLVIVFDRIVCGKISITKTDNIVETLKHRPVPVSPVLW